MKMRRIIIRFALFLFIAIILDQMIGVCLETLGDRLLPKLLTGNRIRMKEFYEHRRNIDILFIGSSYTYMGFNPFIFDDVLNVDSFNLSSGAQSPPTAYYVLKEALRIGHRPKVVVIETHWRLLSGDNTAYDSASWMFHNMKLSPTKLAMFWSAFEFPSSLKLLSRTLKSRGVVHNPGGIVRGLLGRRIVETQRYIGAGYVETSLTASKAALADNVFKGKNFRLNPYRLRFLERMIELAKKHGTQVVLVSTPVAPTAFNDVQGYEEICHTISGIAAKHGIESIDYNILNGKLKVLRDENFMDYGHLNRSGARILSEHLSQWFLTRYGPRLQLLDNGDSKSRSALCKSQDSVS